MEPVIRDEDETLSLVSATLVELVHADQKDETVERDDVLLECLMRWEADYLRGGDPTLDSLCGDDQALANILGERIGERKRLYGLIGLRDVPDEPHGEGAALPNFPGHDVIREIGRGGMGVVYLARDQRLGRVVAIKTIAEARLATLDQVNRFIFEARAVARLRHPNIIAIHAIGEDPRRPYLSLEYVDGPSLAQRLADRPIAPLDAARLLELLALAVQVVHEEGIVHRDLKPSNVLLTALGEPKIADFGLAKLRDGESGHTLSEQVLGTPSFMAPEQAEGQSKQAGPAADVYALGAILYQALTGRPPFLGGSALETLKLVTSTEPVPPRRQRPGVARDLETICLRCLEKDPTRRYTSAAALADDLRRFQEGRPIAARPIGPAGRLWRWSRRNRMLALLATALTVTFVLGTPALLSLWLRARADHALAMTERNRARIERDSAERSRDRAIGAVQVLLHTESDEMLSEEMRPYRKKIIDAGLRESLALVRELDADPRAEFGVIWGYSGLAQFQFEGGEPADGLISLRKAIALAERLAAREPTSVRARETVAMVLQRASTLLPDVGERQSALLRSIRILQALLAETSDGDRRGWLKVLAMNYYNEGHYLSSQGRIPEAIEAFLAARAAHDELLDQTSPQASERLLAAKNLLYLCRVYGDRLDVALEAGRRALAILARLVVEYPDSFEYAHQLYLTQEEIGLKGIAAANWDLAIASLESARKNLKDQAARWGKLVSRMATIQQFLANTDYNLGEACESDPVRFAGPLRELSRELFGICEKLSLVQPLTFNLRIAYAQSCLSQAEYRREDGLDLDLDLLRKADGLWEGIHRQAPGNLGTRASLVIVRRKIAEALEARGQADAAAQWRRQSLTTARGNPDLFFELAASYADSAGLVGRRPTKLDARQRECSRALLNSDAIAMLGEAVADGFHDSVRLRNEPAFEPIRASPEFRAIVFDLEFPADPFTPAAARGKNAKKGGITH